MENREIMWGLGSNPRLGNLEALCLSLGLGIHFEVASNALQHRGWMLMMMVMMIKMMLMTVLIK